MKGSFAIKCSDLIPGVGRYASSALLPQEKRSFKKLRALVAEKGSRGRTEEEKDDQRRNEAQPTTGELSSRRWGEARWRYLGRERCCSSPFVARRWSNPSRLGRHCPCPRRTGMVRGCLGFTRAWR